MSLARKQHADLVRHREFNALRQLMAQRNPLNRLTSIDNSTMQVSKFESTQALTQIDALEMQMSRQLLGMKSTQEFGQTRIASFDEVIATAKSASDQKYRTLAEAAEHFANDRDSQAQLSLEQAIGAHGALHDHTPTWLALLDLYRATNQPDRFEAYALDFSVRFGRSTPPWVSIFHQAELASRERIPTPTVVTSTDKADWSAPLFLTKTELTSLHACIEFAQNKSRQIVIDWRDLAAIDADNWNDLRFILDSLATSTLRCKVHGVSNLEHIFDASLAPAMLAHLALLRCQNQMTAFEDLAMDYCIKFEISPPDWVQPQCRFEAFDSAPKEVASVIPVQATELYGALSTHQATHALQSIAPFDGLVIRCDRLVRANPAGTAIVVQYAEKAKALGYQIEFKNVHRLIEAYFSAQGLNQHAKVTVRKN